MDARRDMTSSGSGTRTKATPVVYFGVPAMQQTDEQQGLRGQVRNFCSQISGKKHHAASLNIMQLTSNGTMRSSKRAVLCGITYNNRKEYMLEGTINDVRNMRELLITQYGYPSNCIRVLTEEEEPQFIPTRRNIMDSLRWLVSDCRLGDSLVFFYSGHGFCQPDFNNDEVDGFDEAICPVDFEEAGMILDNDLNSLIVRPLTRGVTLHAIVDACYSGTILDLTKVYNTSKRRWEDNSPPSGVKKCTNGGLAISISACLDNQIAADTPVFTAGKKNGALTYVLTQILRYQPGPTYGDLFDLIRETFDSVNKQQYQSRPRLANIRILKRFFSRPLYLLQIFTGTKTMTDSMTLTLIQAVENEPGLAYGHLLNAIRNRNNASLGRTGSIKIFYNKVRNKSKIQRPQLSSSNAFDIFLKQLVL